MLGGPQEERVGSGRQNSAFSGHAPNLGSARERRQQVYSLSSAPWPLFSSSVCRKPRSDPPVVPDSSGPVACCSAHQTVKRPMHAGTRAACPDGGNAWAAQRGFGRTRLRPSIACLRTKRAELGTVGRGQFLFDRHVRLPTESLLPQSPGDVRPGAHREGGDGISPPRHAAPPEELSLPSARREPPRLPIDTPFANGAGGGGRHGEQSPTSRTQGTHRTQGSAMSHATNISVVGWGPRTRVVAEQNGVAPDSSGGRWHAGDYATGNFHGEHPPVFSTDSAVRWRGGLLHSDGGLKPRQPASQLPSPHQQAPYIHLALPTPPAASASLEPFVPDANVNGSKERLSDASWNSPGQGGRRASPRSRHSQGQLHADVPIYLSDSRTLSEAERERRTAAGQRVGQRHAAVPSPGHALPARAVAALPAGLSDTARALAYALQRSFLPRMRELLPPGPPVTLRALAGAVRVVGLHQRVAGFDAALDELWAGAIDPGRRGEAAWDDVWRALGADPGAAPGPAESPRPSARAAPFDLSPEYDRGSNGASPRPARPTLDPSPCARPRSCSVRAPSRPRVF